jgi:5'/3'-nucleotidase SurE
VINDDGPPSSQSSPYILTFVRALQAASHAVSVAIPHKQRSWISKAHMVGQTVRPTYYRPPPPPPSASPSLAADADADRGTTHARPLPATARAEEWILLDGTPASCAQLGLLHLFPARGPVDLVVSGPNFGRNTTAVFALSSGTLGGAMEAAACGARAVALSFAHFSSGSGARRAGEGEAEADRERREQEQRRERAEIVGEACRVSVRVVEALAAQWDARVHLYSVNVPLQRGVEGAKVLWTQMLQNRWTSGSCFTEMAVPEDDDRDADEQEAHIRESEGVYREGEGDAEEQKHMRFQHKHFRWSPSFTDVFRSVRESPPGNDGWAVENGYIRSVSPLTVVKTLIRPVLLLLKRTLNT